MVEATGTPTIRLAQLNANDKDFISVLLRLSSDTGPQLFIGLSDEDGNLNNDLMVNTPDDLEGARVFFAKVVAMIDLATRNTGATLN